MNRLIIATIAGGAFIALGLGVPASAQAAPTGLGSAQDVVIELVDRGYNVVVNKVGPAPLDLCTVDSVRPGETVTRPVQTGHEVVSSHVADRTVYLTAKC
jgi:hypothetical protein